MIKYGNLIYDNLRGWVFITDDEENDIDCETLISALSHLGKKDWDLINYSDSNGYIFKKLEKK